MSKELNDFLEDRLRNDLEVACLRAGVASFLLLVLYELPIVLSVQVNNLDIFLKTFFLISLGVRILISRLRKLSNAKWFLLHNIVILLNSLLWAALLFNSILMCANHPELQTLTHLVFVGLIASSTFTLSISKKDFYLFTGPLMLTQTYTFFEYTNNFYYRFSVVAILILFLFFILKQRSRFEDSWVGLRIQNFNLQKIIDVLPGGVIVINQGVITLTNAIIGKIFQNEMALSGLAIDKITFNPRLDNFFSRLKDFNNSGKETEQLEYSFDTNLPSQVHLLSLVKIKDREEIVVSCVDISERKRIEHEIDQQKIRLFNNTKLIVVGEIAGGLLHEINNIVAIISAKSQHLEIMAQQNKLNQDEILKGLKVIDSTTLRISQIIKGLKNLTKGGLNSPRSRANLYEIVESAISLVEEKFKKNGVMVVNKVDPNIFISCVPSQIVQVALNSLYNSFDAISNCEQKWVQINSEVTLKEVRMSITDSGVGIPESIRQKIMDPFFSTKEAGQSTGLGLSISKEIIESHEGSIYFNYANKKNTELVITFPIK